ncbi:hypothetical protein BC2230_60281 [Burkholderia cepacia]
MCTVRYNRARVVNNDTQVTIKAQSTEVLREKQLHA